MLVDTANENTRDNIKICTKESTKTSQTQNEKTLQQAQSALHALQILLYTATGVYIGKHYRYLHSIESKLTQAILVLHPILEAILVQTKF